MLLAQTRHNREGRQALHAAHDKAEPDAERRAEYDAVCAARDARADNHRDAARKVRHQEAVDDPVARTGEESWAGAVSLTGDMPCERGHQNAEDPGHDSANARCVVQQVLVREPDCHGEVARRRERICGRCDNKGRTAPPALLPQGRCHFERRRYNDFNVFGLSETPVEVVVPVEHEKKKPTPYGGRQ